MENRQRNCEHIKRDMYRRGERKGSEIEIKVKWRVVERKGKRESMDVER